MNGQDSRGRTRARQVAAVAIIALVATACTDWTTAHHGADRTGAAFESTIGTANVTSLHLVRSFPAAGLSDPVVVGGVLYAVNTSLKAFDATGATGCTGTPATCTPLWTADTPSAQGVTVANGYAYVPMGNGYGIRAFKRDGTTRCAVDPTKVCPEWSVPGFVAAHGSPAVADSRIYVGGTYAAPDLARGRAYVSVFDAAGSDHCSGVPRTCAPLWTTTQLPSGASVVDSPTLANGIVYVTSSDGQLLAFDAAGSDHCTGEPVVCSPLWTATLGTASSASASVTDGRLYVGERDGAVDVFDAAGGTGCGGVPKTCSPLWKTTLVSIRSTPSVANGVLYAVATTGTLSAFDAGGVSGCGGSPKVCQPLWTYAPGGSGNGSLSAPAIANGVVYFADITNRLHALDAAGNLNCAGGPKTCTDLWSATSGKIGSTSPTVANGVVYYNSSGVSTIDAYAP